MPRKGSITRVAKHGKASSLNLEQRILACVKAGGNQTVIADSLGVHRRTVNRVAKRNGVKTRLGRFDKMVLVLVAIYTCPTKPNCYQLARISGVHTRTVRRSVDKGFSEVTGDEEPGRLIYRLTHKGVLEVLRGVGA